MFKRLLRILVLAKILQYLEQKEMAGERAEERSDLDAAIAAQLGAEHHRKMLFWDTAGHLLGSQCVEDTLKVTLTVHILSHLEKLTDVENTVITATLENKLTNLLEVLSSAQALLMPYVYFQIFAVHV